MPFIVSFGKEIKPESSVVIAVSIENTLQEDQSQTGEKLKAQIDELKKLNCKVTLLLADELQIHNFCLPNDAIETKLEAQKKARDLGDKFILQNADDKTLTASQLAEAKGPITIHGCPLKRWGQYLSEKKASIDKMRTLIDAACLNTENKPSKFYKNMVSTYKKTRGADQGKLENSLNLQKEEYAVVLAMAEFDYLVYPKLTDGLAQVCGVQTFIEDQNHLPIKKPEFAQVKLIFTEVPTPLPEECTNCIAMIWMLFRQLESTKKKLSKEHRENVRTQLTNILQIYHLLNAENDGKNTPFPNATFLEESKGPGTFSLVASPTRTGSALSYVSTPPRSRPEIPVSGETVSVVGGDSPSIARFSFLGTRSSHPSTPEQMVAQKAMENEPAATTTAKL